MTGTYKSLLRLTWTVMVSSAILATAPRAVWGSPPQEQTDRQDAQVSAMTSVAEQDAQDREQEQRDREQEARDREQEKRDHEQEARDRAQERVDREAPSLTNRPRSKSMKANCNQRSKSSTPLSPSTLPIPKERCTGRPTL